MGKRTIRLKDIADKTGFSANTVSLALRESPRIPSATREKIQAAADELNYLPNQIAKSLVSRETKTIGLVLTDITNPLLTKAAQAIELALDELGYVTMFATSNSDVAEEKRVLETFRARQVDGILIYPCSQTDLDHVRRLRRADFPVVSLAGQPEGLDSMGVDDYTGGRKATEHLIANGHTKIGLIHKKLPDCRPAKSRGFMDALEGAGLVFEPAHHAAPKKFDVEAGYHAMAEIMSAPTKPTAVFCAIDSLAVGALKWCLDNKLRVPEDMAIIGYDNLDFAAFAGVSISSINYDAAHVAACGVARLMELIEAEDHLPEPKHKLIEPALIERASTIG